MVIGTIAFVRENRLPILSPWTLAFLGLVGFNVLGTHAATFTGSPPTWLVRGASLLTLGSGVGALLHETSREQGIGRAVGAAALVLLIGLGVELAGTTTGFPFGPYRYTDRWWPVVLLPGERLFPLAVPFAWLMVVAACARIGGWLLASRWQAAILAGGLAAAVDLVMEPVMTEAVRYWVWTERGPLPGGAPWTNFVGWWAVAGLAALAVRHPRPGSPPPTAALAVLAGHLVLLAALALAPGPVL